MNNTDFNVGDPVFITFANRPTQAVFGIISTILYEERVTSSYPTTFWVDIYETDTESYTEVVGPSRLIKATQAQREAMMAHVSKGQQPIDYTPKDLKDPTETKIEDSEDVEEAEEIEERYCPQGFTFDPASNCFKFTGRDEGNYEDIEDVRAEIEPPIPTDSELTVLECLRTLINAFEEAKSEAIRNSHTHPLPPMRHHHSVRPMSNQGSVRPMSNQGSVRPMSNQGSVRPMSNQGSNAYNPPRAQPSLSGTPASHHTLPPHTQQIPRTPITQSSPYTSTLSASDLSALARVLRLHYQRLREKYGFDKD